MSHLWILKKKKAAHSSAFPSKMAMAPRSGRESVCFFFFLQKGRILGCKTWNHKWERNDGGGLPPHPRNLWKGQSTDPAGGEGRRPPPAT